MKLSFKQGIVSAPSTFLSVNSDNAYVDLSVQVSSTGNNGNIIACVTQGNSNYLISEKAGISKAWGPVETIGHLYWEVDQISGAISRKFTTVDPIISATPPTGQAGLIWWNPISKTNNMWDGSRWNTKLIVFAGTYTKGSGLMQRAVGSQVGLNIQCDAGYIVTDGFGKTFRNSDGELLTSDTELVSSESGSSAKLEGQELSVYANENIPKFSLVYLISGKAALASSNPSLSNTKAPMGIVLQDVPANSICEIITSKRIVNNDQWNWVNSDIGKTVYCDDNGNISLIKPNSITYVRVGIITGNQSMLLCFDWATDPFASGGGGGIGPQGPQGEPGPMGPQGPQGEPGTGGSLLAGVIVIENQEQANALPNPGDASKHYLKAFLTDQVDDPYDPYSTSTEPITNLAIADIDIGCIFRWKNAEPVQGRRYASLGVSMNMQDNYYGEYYLADLSNCPGQIALLLDSASADVIDSSALQNNLTNNSVALSTESYLTQMIPSDTGRSFKFNGSQNILIDGDNFTNQWGANWTIEFWMKPTWTGNDQVIISKNVAGEEIIHFKLLSNGNFFVSLGSSSASITFNTSYSIDWGAWAHISVTRKNGATSFKINGSNVLPENYNPIAMLLPVNEPICIGSASNSTMFFTGFLDQVRFTTGYSHYDPFSTFYPRRKLHSTLHQSKLINEWRVSDFSYEDFEHWGKSVNIVDDGYYRAIFNGESWNTGASAYTDFRQLHDWRLSGLKSCNVINTFDAIPNPSLMTQSQRDNLIGRAWVTQVLTPDDPDYGYLSNGPFSQMKINESIGSDIESKENRLIYWDGSGYRFFSFIGEYNSLHGKYVFKGLINNIDELNSSLVDSNDFVITNMPLDYTLQSTVHTDSYDGDDWVVIYKFVKEPQYSSIICFSTNGGDMPA